jgi:hypothetical protein
VGGLNWIDTDLGGNPAGSGTAMQAVEVTQAGAAITFTFASGSGWKGTATGTINGATLSATVQATRDNCTYSGSATDIFATSASPITMTVSTSGTFGGGCTGYKETAQGTMTKGTPPPQVAGTWTGPYSYADKDASGTTVATGSGTTTETWSQTGSAITTTFTSSGGATGSCSGVVVGNNTYARCEGANGSCTFSGQHMGTLNAGPPMTFVCTDCPYTLGGSCAGLSEIDNVTETKQ